MYYCLDLCCAVLVYQLDSLEHVPRTMQDVRLALHLKPHHCIDRNNVGDDGLETLVNNAVFSKTMLRDPKSAQSAGCCEPPTVVHRTYHLLQDILVQHSSDDHLDNLVHLLLVSA